MERGCKPHAVTEPEGGFLSCVPPEILEGLLSPPSFERLVDSAYPYMLTIKWEKDQQTMSINIDQSNPIAPRQTCKPPMRLTGRGRWGREDKAWQGRLNFPLPLQKHHSIQFNYEASIVTRHTTYNKQQNMWGSTPNDLYQVWFWSWVSVDFDTDRLIDESQCHGSESGKNTWRHRHKSTELE